MLRCLMSMSPQQIRQLKYLNVCYSIVSFRLPYRPKADTPSSPLPRSEPEPEPHARGFHVGALLGLFPGLELDLLVLEDGMSGGLRGYEAAHGPDLVESLLQADGFREVRANIRAPEDAFAGNRRLDDHRGGCEKDFDDFGPAWEESIRNRFRGRPGWSVDLYVDEAECPSDHWDRFRDAGGYDPGRPREAH
ncbi:hypothetical protein PG993_008516 [Apiospora rasikravindrae]|uniref:Uncharacterized protein n=1 Tax=Apiospora rasikravindrae TaxID=990691 RepID=A0ABR1T0L2_9PEZI